MRSSEELDAEPRLTEGCVQPAVALGPNVHGQQIFDLHSSLSYHHDRPGPLVCSGSHRFVHKSGLGLVTCRSI